MKIINTFPPNYRTVVKTFPAARGNGVIFTYGDAIYNPSKIDIPPSLIVHEQIHSKRQGTNPDIIEEWWARYISDKKFRFDEELLAHKDEYAWFINSSTKQRRTALKYIARRLASPMYGKLTTVKLAMKLLEDYVSDN